MNLNNRKYSRKFNGWTNYETWCTNLWMSETGDYYPEIAQTAWDQANEDSDYPGQTREQCATSDLSNSLKAEMEDQAEQWMGDQCSMFADMLNSSLASVNWYELAEHLIEEVEKKRLP